MREAAFFDVDGTLIRGNTALIYVRALLKAKKIGIASFAKVIFYVALYNLRILSFRRFSKARLGFMDGLDIKESTTYSRQIFDKHVKGLMLNKMAAEIAMHKAHGRPVVLLTSAPSIIVQPIMEYVKAGYAVATELGEKRGKFNGKIKKLCYSYNKYNMMDDFAKKENIDLKKSWFYTDSYYDIKALKNVGSPVAVNPDRKLRKTALDKGWDIIDC